MTKYVSITLTRLVIFGLIGQVSAQTLITDDIVGIGGIIKSRTDVVVSATSSGNIVALLGHIGERVQVGDVIAKIQCDNQHANYAKNKAAMAKAQANTANTQAQYTDGVLSDTELEIAKAEQAIAKAGIREANTRIAQCTIKAPRGGVIVSQSVEVGQWVQQGDPVAQIVDTNTLYISLNAPESAWITMTPGSSILAHVETTQTVVSAVVVARANYINDNGVFLVEADIEQVDNAIPGMRVIVQAQ